ncbi:DNA mismatch repair protein [Cokeromyces recurvatus]|uniref:DNA mismatch repair protein n=1 Tax=Cokeromyces recurvatus TaxID=90255 RepID=UPI0022204BA7|nr:DNA mismatch repair protein [Cokeromyces recurvatus]KAI7898388.1 DNA mismatch repair protein [Cokeromyces recurvatus]
MITVYKPFYNLPVRRQLATKNALQHIKKIQQELLIKYALAYPKIRFSFYNILNTQNQVWTRPIAHSIEDTLAILYGFQLRQMVNRYIETDPQHPTLTIDMIIPKSNSDPSVILKEDRIFVYVNQRPINYVKSELKYAISMIRDRYRQAIGLSSEITRRKNPFIYLDIQIAPNEYDVNIEPNKTTILLHNKQLVYNLIERILNEAYPANTDFFSLRQSTLPFEPNKESMKDTVAHSNKEIEPYQNNETNQITSSVSDKSIDTKTDSYQETVVADDTVSSLFKNPKRNEWSFSMMSDHSEEEEIDELLSDQDQEHQTLTSISKWQIDNVHTAITHTSPFVQQQQQQSTFKMNPVHDDTIPQSILDSPDLFIPQKRKQSQTKPLYHPHMQQKQQRLLTTSFVHPLPSTLNQVKTIECSLQQIQSNYTQRQEWLKNTHHIRIEDYLLSNRNDTQQTTTILALLSLNKNDLWFYSRGTKQHRDQITELGVVKLTSTCIHNLFLQFLKDYQLICKKNLERPIQIEFKEDNPLCATLLSLKSKEVLVQDDLHGQKEITYSQVIDDTLVWNGFKVRWRKDHVQGILIVQIIAIYDIGQCYGPDDLREILQGIDKNQKTILRPRKVKDHLWGLAERAYDKRQEKDNNTEIIERTLDQLRWERKITKNEEETDWQLGYSPYIPDRILACKLISN